VRTRRLLGATVAVLLLVVVAPAAPSAGAVTELEVEAGYGGAYRSRHPVPVRVRVRADRLLRGELIIRSRGGFGDSLVTTVPVEVPGGSVKEVVVVVPTTSDTDRLQLDAVLTVNGAEATSGSTTVRATSDQELVGLLPGVLQGQEPPAPAPLAVDAGTARFGALGENELAAAPASLGALDVVGASPTDLAALDGATREAVLVWVAQGGHLLVDSLPGEEVDGLPAGWQPGDDGRSAAGLGEVRATAGAMASGNWSGLVEPTPVGTLDGGEFFDPAGLDRALATDAGLRIPQLGWLVGFLLLYVLVAVPLTLTVLRRRGRGELGWVALPLVALVFTGVAYVAGRQARGETDVAHATILHTTPAGAMATTTVGVVSPGGGSVDVLYPHRWTPAGRSFSSGGPPADLAASLGPEGTTVRQRLDVGQFGVHRSRGPASVEGALEVEAAASGDDRLEGRVRNTLPFALEQVAVLHHRLAVNVGRLEPGEEKAWELDLRRRRGDDHFPTAAFLAWPEASGFDRPPDPDSVVTMGLWSQFEADASAPVLAPGQVVAAGWTRDHAPPVGVAKASLSGRSLVVGTGPVNGGGRGLVPAAVRTEVVRGPFTGTGMFDERAPLVVRLVLQEGSGAASGDVEVRAPAMASLAVWAEGRWQTLAGGRAAGADGSSAGGGRGAGAAPMRPPPMPPDAPATTTVSEEARAFEEGMAFEDDAFAGSPLEPPDFGEEHPYGPPVGYTLPAGAIDGGVVWVRVSAGGGEFGMFDPFMLSRYQLVTLGPAS
jgi:hypothetical protein